MSRRSPSAVVFKLRDGREVDASILADGAAESVTITALEALQPRFFEHCPICGGPATDLEHIPPASLGGQALTKTCKSCNNDLGSRVEVDLTDWFDNALTLPRFAASNVKGARKASRILWRTGPSGEVVLFIDGDLHPTIFSMLDRGEVDLSGFRPDPRRYRIALLKHAYLAACIKFGVLEGDVADQIRNDLIAARDATQREAVPTSALAMGLTVLRRFDPVPVDFPPVVAAVAHVDGELVPGVLLVGSVFVSWISTMGPASLGTPTPTTRLSEHLKVGGMVEGEVRSVRP